MNSLLKILSLATFTILMAVSCRQPLPKDTLFSLQENTGINFANHVENSPQFNIFSYRNFYNGGGVAIGDINNDGNADVFFTANMGSNKLYLNKGNWNFEDISTKAGFINKNDWSTGVVFVDINADGWLDIFVCNAGYINGVKPKCQLFINNHDLTFTDKASEYGLTNEGGYTTHAAFFDYDLDGDLDCFIINNSFIPVNTLNYANKRDLRAKDWPVADFLKGGGDHMFRNDQGKFVDVSEAAGINGSLISFGLGVTVGDVNGDQYPDVYVSNDFFERDYLYINQKNGTFKDELEKSMQHISHSSMGADMADVNNDGYPDIFTTDMLPDDDYRLKTTTSFDNIDVFRIKQKSGFYHQFTQNSLQINNQHGKFMEAGFYAGVAASDWSWGGLIFDADNDGLSDIFVCNGIYNDVTNQDFIDFFANDIIQKMVMTGRKEEFEDIVKKMPSQPIANKFFKNKGDLKFSDEAASAGLGTPSFSNGSAYGDLDNDGDLDLIVNNSNSPAFIYKNESREKLSNNYLAIQLKGKGANTFAVGSKIKVFKGKEIINRELIPTRGFQSSVDYKQILGVGKGAVDSVVITWPDLATTTLLKPTLNKIITIDQTAAQPFSTKQVVIPTTLLEAKATNSFDKHIEDDFIDFYNERNIPVMLSREGPKADTADVNGDGKTDIYVGGATGQSGQLYMQTSTGFSKKQIPVFEADKAFEDVAVLFFDADKDGDQDLFVGAGGNVQTVESNLLQYRLYINDGKGNFSKQALAFPDNHTNVAVAVAADIDQDGDQDLFVGSRSVPQYYGASPESYIYLNNGDGHFTASVKKPIGMITDAVFTDVVGNAQKELIVVGEWMSPIVYTVSPTQLTEINTNLSALKGWWQSIAVADLDGDQRNDLILGNLGENCYLKPTSNAPVKLWINDFDMNGTYEKVLSRSIKGRDVPVFLKREMTDQMPGLKKQNLKFDDFAKKSIQELFTTESIEQAHVLEFNYASSCIAYNKKEQQFTVTPLPTIVQFSSVNAIQCFDVNGDGKKDLVLGGNQFYLQPQFGRLDASYGQVLLNEGKGSWNVLLPSISGLEIRGEVKDIIHFNTADGSELLFLQNDELPQLYKIRPNFK